MWEWFSNFFSSTSDSSTVSAEQWADFDKQTDEYMQYREQNPEAVASPVVAPEITIRSIDDAPQQDAHSAPQSNDPPTDYSSAFSPRPESDFSITSPNYQNGLLNSLGNFQLDDVALGSGRTTEIANDPVQSAISESNKLADIPEKPLPPKDDGGLLKFIKALDSKGAAALVQGGFGILSGAAQGEMLRKKLSEERKIRAEEIARQERNANPGTVSVQRWAAAK